ncbi:hypothetical protein AAMO2058_000245000 [Amorphochlora amoebiformis]
MPGNTQSARLIREVWNANQDAKRDKAVNLMSKIFRNVLKDPSEAKYRKIKRTAIDKRLGSIVGALALLKHVGFEPIVEHYVLASNKDLSALVDAVEEFDSREAKRAAAAQKLKEVLEINNKKVKAEMQKKEAHRKKIKMQTESAQKDVRTRVITDSKANTLNFGMKLKKFVPPKDPPKGG